MKGAGREFYHAAIDDATRLAVGEVMESERSRGLVAFLKRVGFFFEHQGVTISHLMAGNGSAYRPKLCRRTLEALGILHILARPYTPKTNESVERFIRMSAVEWTHGRADPDSQVRTRALRTWLDYYRLTRRHTGVGCRTPFQRLVELRVTNVLATHTSEGPCHFPTDSIP